MSRVRPILDRVVVQYEDYEEVSSGGIIIGTPKKYEHPNRKGTVLAVGPGLNNSTGEKIPMSVSVGDKIEFTGTSGMECPWDDLDNILVITENDILYVFDE